MPRAWWYKVFGVLALTIIAIGVLVPTFLGPELPACDQADEEAREVARAAGQCADPPGWYAWYAENIYDGAIVQGLDLQGGLHMQYRVDIETAFRRKLDTFATDIMDALEREGHTITFDDIEVVDETTIDIQLPEGASDLLDEVLNRYPLERHNQGGGLVRLETSQDYIDQTRTWAIETAISTIRSRVDGLGVAEPVIRSRGDSDIIVELPGLGEDRVEEAKNLIGTTAQLEFRGIHPDDNFYWSDVVQYLPASGCLALDRGSIVGEIDHVAAAQGEPTCTIDDFRSFVDILEALEPSARGAVPRDAIIGLLERTEYHPATGDPEVTTYRLMLLSAEVEMTGETISDARVASDPTTNMPYVSLTFDGEGARQFCDVTTEYEGRPLPIVLDDIIKSAPTIEAQICSGMARITMGSTGSYEAVYNDAQGLVIVLRHGALPAPIEPQFETQVGPSLGADSIQKGTLAMAVGSILVIIFMLIYYRGAGLIANVALTLNIVFILALLALVRATVTLPGIAGIILTIGMAVDANVIIFERIREELRLGKTARDAVASGYQKALSTVLDANITTAIASLVLMNYGSGPVKGFAVTLFFGIICSVFTALIVTRLIFEFVLVKGRSRRLSI
jgi:protein-export membrane protein SecD